MQLVIGLPEVAPDWEVSMMIWAQSVMNAAMEIRGAGAKECLRDLLKSYLVS